MTAQISNGVKKIIFILIIIILAGAFFYFQKESADDLGDLRLKTEIQNNLNLPAEILEKYRQEALNLEASILKKKITDMSGDEKNEQFTILYRLGVVRKVLEDYQGAASVWVRAALIAPENSAPLSNLAALYAYSLKNYQKAEEFYLRALQIFPTTQNYRALADLYRYFMTDKVNRVEETIFQGLKVFPDNVDLWSYLATYYRDLGQKEKAIEYFEKILKINPDHPGAKQDLEMLNNG